MKGKMLIAELLIVLLAITSVAAARSPDAPDASDATKITEEEQREVTQLAERFVRRMGETGDLAPLIGEMFVSDYADRLHREAVKESLFLMRKSVAEQASRDDLVRYQLALNNCWYVMGLLVAVYEASHAMSDDEEREDKLINALPPDVLDLFKNDPVLASLYEAEANERAEENRPGATVKKFDMDDGIGEPIASVEQLRSFTSTLEQASIRARRYLGALPVKPKGLARYEGANEEEHREAERDWMRPRAWTLNEEFYGYPKETRIFCANVLIYHMDLIRVEGKLKILALSFNLD